MPFDIPYFDQLPLKYQSAVNTFHKDLLKARSPQVRRRVFISFVKKYTTVTPIWKNWQRVFVEPYVEVANKKWSQSLEYMQFDHFYSYELISDLQRKHPFRAAPQKIKDKPHWMINKTKTFWPFKDNDAYKEFLESSEEALSYPTPRLEQIYFYYRLYSGVFLTEKIKSTYRKSLTLLNELQAVNNNDALWAETLLKSKNQKFITEAFEFRLEQCPWYPRLWKLFIDYLKSSDNLHCLNFYSRYCRLFIDDTFMFEKYCLEIAHREILGNEVSRFWIDAVKIQLNFSSITEGFSILELALKTKAYKPRNLVRFARKLGKKLAPEKVKEIESLILESRNGYFDRILVNSKSENILWNDDIILDIENMQILEPPSSQLKPLASRKFHQSDFSVVHPQTLQFPHPMASLIISKASYRIRHKLIQACKHFFVLYQTPICCNVTLANQKIKTFFQQSIRLHEDYLLTLKNFYLCNSLDVWLSEDDLLVSKLLRTIAACNLKFIKLHTQKLTWNEFEMLTAPGNLESVYLVTVDVYHDGGAKATIEELIEKFPKAEAILLYIEAGHSSQTGQKLLTMDRKVKLRKFELCTHELDIETFCQFIMNNAAPKATFDIIFSLDIGDHITEIRDHMNRLLEAWVPVDERPVVSFQ